MKSLSFIAIFNLLLLASGFVPATHHRPAFFHLTIAAAAERDAKTADTTTTSAAAPKNVDLKQQKQNEDKVAETTNQVMESTSPEDLVVNAGEVVGEEASDKESKDEQPPVVTKDRIFDPTKFWTTHSGQF